jgi:nitronate monooxygenase
LNIPELKIGDLVAKLPIIQGGMGVGISLSGLASAVANCGGIGVISGVETGFNQPNYLKDKANENAKALKYHIQRARELSPAGIIGVNIMVALNNFKDMVKEAVRENIDIIFSGAGLPLELPSLVENSKTKIVPIVSSAKAAQTICRYWDKKNNYCPDAIVVEGSDAGGHLGFSEEDLQPENRRPLIELVKDVLNTIKVFEEKYLKKIPVIAAGGVFTGADIGELLNAGASGVQLGSRFVATYECDASQEFKDAYLQASKEDIGIIKSPVGMLGRAIKNKFLEAVSKGERTPPKCVYHCLKPCNPRKAPYCIADALINAQKGHLEKGFAFAGSNVYRINKIVSVKELMEELVQGIIEYQPAGAF